jgi:hypothetical protein
VHYLQPAVFAYNTSPREKTGLSPFYTLFGREAYLPFEPALGLEPEEWGERSTWIDATLQRFQTAHNYVKNQLDESRTNALKQLIAQTTIPVFRVGDKVYVRNYRRGPTPGPVGADKADKTQETLLRRQAFAQRYEGPYIVRQRIGQVNYAVSPEADPHAQRLVHVDDLRRTQEEHTSSSAPRHATTQESLAPTNLPTPQLPDAIRRTPRTPLKLPKMEPAAAKKVRFAEPTEQKEEKKEREEKSSEPDSELTRPAPAAQQRLHSPPPPEPTPMPDQPDDSPSESSPHDRPWSRFHLERKRQREVTTTTGRSPGGHELRHPSWRPNYSQEGLEQLNLLENAHFYSLSPQQTKKPKK